MNYVFDPLPPVSVPVIGTSARFPVHRIYCVGRNYEEHAKEMGFSGREPPFFFMKPTDAVLVVNAGESATLPYYLQVNGQERQRSNISKLIWNIAETIAHLSAAWRLQAGDLIYTGTPEGVATVVPGDTLTGGVTGLVSITITVK